MDIKKKDIINGILIFIISFVLVSDLFINKGHSATFDGPTHIANIALFNKSISQGEYRVTWTDGFANYGMPLGLMAQQVTSYIGAWINVFIHNIVLSYNLVFLIGAFLSTLFFYLLLRLYFNPAPSFLGAFLFNFAPYRIINIYIRGALPEFFANVFLPLMLIGIYFIFNQKLTKGFILLALSTALMVLTHPMIVIVSSFIFIPYLMLCIWEKKKIFSVQILVSLLAMVLGVGLAGYYIFPLMIEIKYFYYGLAKNHFAFDQYLGLKNFFDPKWYYFSKIDVFTRVHLLKSGLFETLIILSGLVLIVINFLRKKRKVDLLFLSVILAFILAFLMTKASFPIYRINLLGSIQRQWRMFSSFIFLPPIVIAYFYKDIDRKIFYYLLIIFICVIRFPQLYGKNYTFYPENYYFFYKENLHANILNTIWTGEALDYPVKKEKPEIVEGKGIIVEKQVRDSLRQYKVNAETDIRMADYTFYFPGWRAYIDGRETTIQFQDPEYRGVITYYVPSGEHRIDLLFTDTKVRKFGIVISIFSIVSFFAILFFLNRYR